MSDYLIFDVDSPAARVDVHVGRYSGDASIYVDGRGIGRLRVWPADDASMEAEARARLCYRLDERIDLHRQA